MTKKIKVALLSNFPEGKSKLARVRGREVAVFHHKGQFYALANFCPHQGGPLGEGFIDGESVICPWHHWDFHLETGCSRLGPDVKVKTYPTVVEDETVFILEET